MANPNQDYFDGGQEEGIVDAAVQYAPSAGDQHYNNIAGQDSQRYDQGDEGYEESYIPRGYVDGTYEGENTNVGGGYEGRFEDHQTAGDYSAIPDMMLLNYFCANAQIPRDLATREEADLSWEPVRDWLRTHSAAEVRAAVQQRGDFAMTALHNACGKVPPLDIIDILLSVGRDTAEWPDSSGRLPLHLACYFSADPKVIKRLVDAYPESKTMVDGIGRTPLHCALSRANREDPISTAVVVMLSNSGAATIQDKDGMLPLHYACAYGTSEENLYILTGVHEDGITSEDKLGRTPLRFALSNAGNKTSPAAVRLLLSLRRDIVNASKGESLPLRVLAEYAATVRKGETEKRESVLKCLEHILSFNPDPTADFFTALQSLPEWLKERAVVMRNVQQLLNVKIAQRFPTGLLLSDFFFQILVLLFYALAVRQAIDQRFDSETTNDNGTTNYREPVEAKFTIPLYIGGAYFLLRALIQIFSLLALGAFRVWFENPSNWLDMTYIFVVFFWAIRMGQSPGDVEPNSESDFWDENDVRFRTGAALSVVVIWVKFLAYLRNTYIDFAVFLGGLFYVVRRLVAFLLCLCIILIAFAQMFFTVYRQEKGVCCELNADNVCVQESDEIPTEDFQCDAFEGVKMYCNRWTAFLNTFTMLLGEVDETTFSDDPFALALFVVFMFLVVILLANVLIAIVTDSYKVIQDQRAAIVFWSNRLVFVAESDSVANGPWKRRIKEMFGLPVTDNSGNAEVTFGKDTWERLMDLYYEEVDNDTLSFEFIFLSLMRIFAALIIIPLWILIGLISFGSLWPPQIREYIFTSKVLKHSSKADEDDELRKRQTRTLQEEVKTLKDDLLQELAIDRTQVVQTKSLVAERKQEIQSEMKHIKRIVAMLFEQQSGL